MREIAPKHQLGSRAELAQALIHCWCYRPPEVCVISCLHTLSAHQSRDIPPNYHSAVFSLLQWLQNECRSVKRTYQFMFLFRLFIYKLPFIFKLSSVPPPYWICIPISKSFIDKPHSRATLSANIIHIIMVIYMTWDSNKYFYIMRAH